MKQSGAWKKEGENGFSFPHKVFFFHFKHMSKLTPKDVGKSNAEQYKPAFTDRSCKSADVMRLAEWRIAYTAYAISHTVVMRCHNIHMSLHEISSPSDITLSSKYQILR
jgi:hypothetical protein